MEHNTNTEKVTTAREAITHALPTIPVQFIKYAIKRRNGAIATRWAITLPEELESDNFFFGIMSDGFGFATRKAAIAAWNEWVTTQTASYNIVLFALGDMKSDWFNKTVGA